MSALNSWGHHRDYLLGQRVQSASSILSFLPSYINRKILLGSIVVLAAAPLTAWAASSQTQNNSETSESSSTESSLDASLPSSESGESLIISDDQINAEIKGTEEGSQSSITVHNEVTVGGSGSEALAPPDVTVNGHQIEVPDNGRLNQTIKEDDSTTRLRIRSNSDASSNNSSFNIQIDSN